MSRYRGPRFKIIRRLRALPGLTNKWPKFRIFRRTQSRFVKKNKYEQQYIILYINKYTKFIP